MRIPRPIVALVWRYASENKRLRGELDTVRQDLSVAKCRERRWRRHAELVSQGNPRAERAVAFQAASDDLADLPEIEPHRRFPRSLP